MSSIDFGAPFYFKGPFCVSEVSLSDSYIRTPRVSSTTLPLLLRGFSVSPCSGSSTSSPGPFRRVFFALDSELLIYPQLSTSYKSPRVPPLSVYPPSMSHGTLPSFLNCKDLYTRPGLGLLLFERPNKRRRREVRWGRGGTTLLSNKRK